LIKEKIKNLELQDPFEEYSKNPIEEPENVKVIYYLLIVFVLITVNIVLVLLITWNLGISYLFIFQ